VKTVLALVNEAIGNGFRHGYANQVSVSFAHSETEVTVVVKDNSLGPRGSSPGLGSLLYDSCGSWSLTPGADGGSELVIKISLAQ
jgi:signal transduction histidine kinase